MERLRILAKTSLDAMNKASLNVLSRTSVGVYISDERIELAVLRQTRDGVTLVEAAGEPIPPGAVDNGSIKEPAILTKVIKQLSDRCKIRAKRTAVSLFARPVLTQIMDLPEDLPSNVGQYVRKEVKHCAVLPSRNISLDFCGAPSPSQSAGKRVFVVAAENEKVVTLIKALNDGGLNVESVEPANVACARGLYEKKMAGSASSNILIALVEGAEITLSVFQNQNLDFVRRRNVAEDVCQSEEGLARLVEEISAIIQYYDVEIGEKSDSWRLITVLCRGCERADEIADLLRSKFGSLESEVISEADASENTPVVRSPDAPAASLIATGLAMGLLNVPQPKLKINLIPPESADVKAVKKYALITANIAAGVLIVMILAVGVLSAILNKTNETIVRLKQEEPVMGTTALLAEHQKISQEAEELREKLTKINEILHSKRCGDWHEILEDIRRRTPQSLWITNLSGEDDSKIVIRGRSTTYEAVNLFVDMLGESEYMVSAALVEAEKDESGEGLVSYWIDCSLTTFEGT